MDTRHFNQEVIWEGETASVSHTVCLGGAVGKVLIGGGLVGLSGELGAGKTQFVRGLAEGIGADPHVVSSPTYVLVQEYESGSDGPTLVHIDAYRLMTESDLDSIGWSELAAHASGAGCGDESYADTIVVVEWADRIGEHLPARRLEIQIEHVDDKRRHVTCCLHGQWDNREVDAMKDSIEQADTGFRTEVADFKGSNGSKEITTKCPICGGQALTHTPNSPFCSDRCKTIDLGRWASGAYMISRPIEHSDLDEGE